MKRIKRAGFNRPLPPGQAPTVGAPGGASCGASRLGFRQGPVAEVGAVTGFAAPAAAPIESTSATGVDQGARRCPALIFARGARLPGGVST